MPRRWIFRQGFGIHWKRDWRERGIACEFVRFSASLRVLLNKACYYSGFPENTTRFLCFISPPSFSRTDKNSGYYISHVLFSIWHLVIFTCVRWMYDKYKRNVDSPLSSISTVVNNVAIFYFSLLEFIKISCQRSFCAALCFKRMSSFHMIFVR